MSGACEAIPIPRSDNGIGLRGLVVLSGLMGFASIATDMYLPAMPILSDALHAGPGGMEFTISAYLIGFSLGQLFWGPVGDRLGRRMPIAVGVVLFIIGSAGCALSGSVWQMIFWRVLQALGACAGPVLARAMVRDLYPRERSAQMLSTLMTVMAIAPLLGPLVGGQILAFSSWHAIFWTQVAWGVLILAAVFSLPETLARERRNAHGLVQVLTGYLVLLRNPRVMGYALTGGLYYGGAFAYVAGTPFAYIGYHHVPAEAYGLLFGLGIVGVMAANLMNVRLVPRLGSARLLQVGAILAAVSGIVSALDARFGWGGLVGLVVPLFVYMSVAGLIVANSVAGALASFPHRAGAVSALVGALHYGTGMLGAAAVGWFSDGTPWPMGWIIAAFGIGSWATAALMVRSRPCDVRA